MDNPIDGDESIQSNVSNLPVDNRTIPDTDGNDITSCGKQKFPVALIKSDMHIPIGEKIMLFVLKYAKSNGGYEESFGYSKKAPFLVKAIEFLFSIDGPLNK